ncbi:sigma-54-dependent transcriptional regulator [Oligoflexus tunisiensis]|uniref:sigma-54-dependent transcriptional regulator n=1 Tax=Oligoflexus tunisiensis TaxID=708132 RepID=UPI00114CE17C|nr:sigma 54-interacting transcriptional regulator [Oligoflexus tunisiensis]
MFEKRKILFVEDDSLEIGNISVLLRSLGVGFTHTATVSEAVRELVLQPYDYLLTDLHIETKAGFEKPDGLTVIRAAVEQQPNITIVATSSDPRTEVVNAALTAGAHHFVRKPLSKADEIEIAFRLANQRRRLARGSRLKTPSGLWEAYAKKYPYGIILGEREHKVARLAARKKASCIITGETGTGKEEAAKLIHRMRCEEDGPIPFVAVNCATITGNLAESLLFGHKKGAFTGADEAASGYITEADGGILFLDEIQTLSIPVQQKLLRVLNDGSYHRLGEARTHRSEFQLIAASTKDLGKEVDEGRFLVDIHMRMMGLDFHMPPLRERMADLPAFVALFLSRKNIALNVDTLDDLIEKLQTYQWQGNIRQLFKCLDAWLLYCELDCVTLSADNFPLFKDLQALQRPVARAQGPKDEIDFNTAANEDRDFDQLMADFERTIVSNAMSRHGSISSLSKALNIPRSTLDAKRRKYNLI